MCLDEFDYRLPEELIAQFPLRERTAARLLHVIPHATRLDDLRFTDLRHLLRPGDLLVFNDTKVIPARLHGRKSSGGKVEFLLERRLDGRTTLAQLKASKLPQPGARLIFGNDAVAEVKARRGEFFVIEFAGKAEFERLLGEWGEVPLPPYIRRDAQHEDVQRYQTVYAKHDGAVAAPTAGLHFDKPMLERLRRRGVERAYVTLHVGAGTFQPVRARSVEEHVIHAEKVEVSRRVCKQIMDCKERGGRVVAVGTTVVRALESAVRGDRIHPYTGDTRLFIYPGFQFRAVDALVTNFHLPRSTLLMLVCAFAGRETIMSAYRHAVARRYRFYSYGDAMFIGMPATTDGNGTHAL